MCLKSIADITCKNIIDCINIIKGKIKCSRSLKKKKYRNDAKSIEKEQRSNMQWYFWM
jgi:hypothetical protein